MKNILWIILLFMITGCTQCNQNYITIENGPLSDSVLEYVPYQNGKIYKLRHSNGLIVNFKAQRETLDETSRGIEYFKNIIHYQTNTTILTPDYPVFNMRFNISNFYTEHIDCYATIGRNSFYIPTYDDLQNPYMTKEDSVLIDTTFYKNVFLLKADFFSDDSIYVDSIYYNYEFGILKLKMSNEEYYTIYK